jgi:NAD(P)-dependent dehydrogenase (short-subunit alcohol dehydrogenase family)
MRLKEKVSIITGAGNGIGKAIATKFAQEGAMTVIADIDEARARQAADAIVGFGGTAMAVRADISDKEDVDAMIAKAIGRFGGIDVLVNNAGVLHSTPIDEITEEEWDRIFAVNMKGTFLCCQAVLPFMREKGEGRIINIASNAGRDGGVSTGLAYASSKAAVIGFTRGLARRMAPYGITCNAIAPGTTKSDMISVFSEEKLQYVRDSIPLGRLGEPEDIAELACLIASQYGSFITGATIDINGGLFIG